MFAPTVSGALLVLAACGDDGASTSAGFQPGILSAGVTLTTTDGEAPTSTAVPTTGAADSTAGASATGGGPKFDLGDDGAGGGSTGAPGGDAGCAKLDFLFVVDDSGSMAGEQKNLIASFPGFIATITETLEAHDFHIMVVSTNDGSHAGKNSLCINGDCTCAPAPVCCQTACAMGTTCDGFDCNNLPIDACDFTYGAGKRYDAGGKHCGIAGERRYMLADQPDVAAAFECVAAVGTYGSGDERPMQAAAASVSPAQNGKGGCDEGFLRDDAILVLTFITDEEDDHDMGKGSPGDPMDWYDAVVAAKQGNEGAVVVLGLVGDSNLPGGICPPGVDPNKNGNGAEDAPRLQQFTQLFSHGVVGSVCAPDFTPFFTAAVGVIDAACDDFDPPG